jgi:3-keto steroid reductase
MSMDAENGGALPSSRGRMGRMSTFTERRLTSRVLGLKIAQRMLESVAPLKPGKTSEQDERIRIILACRSRTRAEGAVKKLRSYFSDRTLLLDIEDLDLCSMRNIEDFCSRLLARYAILLGIGGLMKRGCMIDWLIFNAGVSEVYAFDWIGVIEQFLFDTMLCFTLPRFLVERVGSVTEDGMPLIFQANTFGHYYIVSLLHPNRTELMGS